MNSGEEMALTTSVAQRCRTSVITGPAALRLHGINTFQWVSRVDVALRGRARAFEKPSPRQKWVYRSGVLHPKTIVQINGIDTVDGIRALFDTYRYHGRADALVAIESARNSLDLTAADLLQRAGSLPRAKGLRGFRQLIEYSAATSESPLETLGRDRILRAIESGALTNVGSVAFQVERRIISRFGEYRKALIDAMLTNVIGIEFDGKIKQSGTFGDPDFITEEERWREKQLQNQGLVICRFGWSEVISGQFIRTVQNLLGAYPRDP